MGLLDESWRRGGFGDTHDELQFLDRARDAMRAYWRSEEASESEPAFLERQFEFKVGPHFLRGRVDRVDRNADGEFEVIAYKTGQRVDSGRHGGDIQLALYRLGAREAAVADLRRYVKAMPHAEDADDARRAIAELEAMPGVTA